MNSELSIAIGSIILATASLVLAQLRGKSNKDSIDSATVSITTLQQQIILYMAEIDHLRSQLKQLNEDVDRLARENLRLLRIVSNMKNGIS